MAKDKTNTSQGGTQANPGGTDIAAKDKQRNPGNVDTQKAGTTGGQGVQGGQKGAQGSSQMGGKSPPSGGPDLYKPNQPMEGEKKGPGSQGTSRDPYPPTNPERPVMASGQQGGQAGSPQGGSQFGGNVGASSGTGFSGAEPAIAGKGGASLEEEEE